MFSGDKSYDESGWGTFDTDHDADAAWDINAAAKVKGYIFILVIKKEEEEANGYIYMFIYSLFQLLCYRKRIVRGHH